MIALQEKLLKEDKLTPSAKLFFMWLQTQQTDTLDKGNVYFANEFDVTTMTITNWLFTLEAAGYIEIQYYKRNRKILCKY